MPEITDQLLTTRDLARILRVSMPTVYQYLHCEDPAKRLASFRPGHGAKIFIRREDFDDWLTRQPLKA